MVSSCCKRLPKKLLSISDHRMFKGQQDFPTEDLPKTLEILGLFLLRYLLLFLLRLLASDVNRGV